jgi:hypothetical protein
MKKDLSRYSILFNHDGTNAFCTHTPYQRSDEPACVEQMQGLVDEAAEAGCDTLLLSPAWCQIVPLWISDRAPIWQEKGRDLDFPDSVQGKINRRIRDFLLAGHDFVGITERQCKKRGMHFFLSWRMFDVHGLDHPDDPWTSDFYRNNPQLRIGDPTIPATHGKIALDFQHREVRSYQLGLIEELVQRYDVDGIELDFMRTPTFFSRRVPYEGRARFMREFIVGVRKLLDARGQDRPICVRVPQKWDIALEIGLDLKAWSREGLIDMVNISPFYETSADMDIEDYRENLPDAKIFGEITQCSSVQKYIELGIENSRKMTAEMIRTTAETFLSRGADGISLFNFVYYRDYSFGTVNKPDKFEPPFAALHNIADRKTLADEPKHYVLAQQNWFYQKQFPLDLANPGPRRPQATIHISADFTDPEVRKLFLETAVLRLQFQDKIQDAAVLVLRLGRLLTPCHVEGELFPTPYIEGVPKDHSNTLDYELPLELLEKGRNTFTLWLDRGDQAVVNRLEIAVYRKDGIKKMATASESVAE